MRILYAHLFVAFFLAAPAREENAKAPDLNYESNWGTMKQDGTRISIGGHNHWTAAGEVQKNGKVYLLWATVEDNRLAPSLYEFKDGALVGKWGWLGDVEFDEMGEITGSLHDDTISKVQK